MTTRTVLDETFRVLASEHRRSIIRQLSSGPVEGPALSSTFTISKQALNRHLVLLEDAGLIERQLQGRVHQLALRPASLDPVTDWVSDISKGWSSSFDRLDQLLKGDTNG